MKIKYKNSGDFLKALKMYYEGNKNNIVEQEAVSVEHVLSDKVFYRFEGNEAKPDKDLSTYIFYFVTSRSLGWVLEYSTKSKDISLSLRKTINDIGFLIVAGEVS